MKRLKYSATITAVLGVLAAIALVFLYLALSDIADSGTGHKLEWYISGMSLIALSAFTISTFITLALFLKTLRVSERLTVETHLDDVDKKDI